MQVLCGHPQRLGGEWFGRFVGGLPKDAGATLGTDDRVVGMFQQADPVADADAERPAGAAFPDDDANYRRGQPRHLQNAGRDELGLPALLGADTRVSPWRVDQADDRQAKLGGEPHLLHRLAIPFRVCAAVEALAPLFQRVPLLMADDQDAGVTEPGEAGPQRPVIAERPVAVQLDELLEDEFDVIAELRPALDAREFDRLPGRQTGVLLPLECGQFAADAADLVLVVRRRRGFVFQLLELVLEVVDVFLERQSAGRGHETPEAAGLTALVHRARGPFPGEPVSPPPPAGPAAL